MVPSEPHVWHEVELFLESDWDRCSVKKPWMHRDAWIIHASCGGFIAILDQLQESVPSKDFKENVPALQEQFNMGLLDGDIFSFLEGCVPPISLEQVPFVRTRFWWVEF